MARSLMGAGVADFVYGVFEIAGHQLVDLEPATLTLWSAKTGGTQYTDLLLDGVAVTSIPVGEDGQVPQFQGPDGITSVWADAGGPRVLMTNMEGLAAQAVAAAASVNREAANGVAGLDASGKLYETRLPTTVAKVANLPTPILSYASTAATNQTANVQAAVDATPTGGTLEVPAGVQIRVDGQVNVNRAMTIRSPGRGGFYSGAGTTPQKMFNVTADGVTFDNLRIVGPQFTVAVEQQAVWAIGTLADRIYKLRVTSCEIEQWSASAIWVKFVGVFTLNNNDIHDIGYAGIAVSSGSVGSVSFNRVHNVTGAGWPDSYGMFFSKDYGTQAVEPRTEDVAIHGNTITDVPNWAGIDSHAGRGLSIVGNTVRNCKMPITMVSSKESSGGAYVFATIDTAVVGNVVDAGAGYGTHVSVHFVGNDTEKATGCLVGNTIRGMGGYMGEQNYGGIELVRTRGMAVTGNTIIEPSPCGIILASDNVGFAISGNTVTDPWADVAFTKAVWVDGNNNSGIITGNALVTGAKTAPKTNANGMGIALRSGTTGNDILLGTNRMSAALIPYDDPGGVTKSPLGAVPTITGAKGSNAALTSLLTALAAKGLIVNSTT